MSVSTRHLQRAFQSNGDSVASAVQAARARTAADYLDDRQTPKISLTALATLCGFSSSHGLRAAFKRVYGDLPSRYPASA
ncbi:MULTISPECIES: helix-turn-helix domain-containing protein [Subtercola]|uniref:helix-turn-helix domain-containing protein n=1 Tax=Subtercola TaxID=120212 RepID=UPI0013759F28|nr:MULTISPECIES: helix-turn-helix domain-containing protein [Subtercola]MEA9986203.1 helix-turn-helix domain-containing protein [Subtercola sp. RTI3]